MIYLKEFPTHAEYETYIGGESKVLPNVSVCDDQPEHVHYNPVPPAQFDFVDLGLPSGLKWAKANLGAETETNYGKYFQWGDTVGYTDASHSTWSTCPFNDGSSSLNQTYFNAHKSEWLDSNNILKPEYDAGYQQSGGKCRIPTKTEWQELINNTTNQWVENYNGSGVNGRLLTSKTNSNSIFIPAAGLANSGLITIGSMCTVWSSSMDSSHIDRAYYFGADSVNCGVYDYDRRFYGQSIRCVSE